MPSLDARLAWAVPVDIEVVGPNVEAFIKLQPIINALRLCHRFGNSGAPITRLPVELLNNIEEVLLKAEREKQREQWQEDYQCFRQACSTLDHYTEEDIDEIRGVMGICECDECGESGRHDPDESFVDLLEESDTTFEVHHERRNSWLDRMEQISDRGPLLTKFFGLTVWTSTVRLNRASKSDPFYAADMTMAYLSLPNAPTVQTTMAFSDYETDMFDMPRSLQTGCGMDVTEHVSRPKDVETLFNRAMRILDLKPYVSGGQEGRAAGLDEVQDGAAYKDGQCKRDWPRLTMLTNTGS
ncbi:hypothetical protein M409DRAFT_17990 [Zasmidium cellare ATCC 36951]|uniref:Uncharacterized protein n=1 Tax=Zasmidium cellare ATCC 36951 TaxID=1080233 RepID=A0A6A6CXJ3_ZASCE|nr:uncharacterized protein M409DRAFT_17990 [Zasmidium cellare ATCC 36951]KAF2171755.1 hypothetical protein M409DRAFT_17990 [Zasmidium cellare ATCC 36951]